MKVYQRLGTRGKDPSEVADGNTLVPSPDGPNPSSYSGHSYYYSEITTEVQGKKAMKRNRATLELVQRYADYLIGLEQE